MPKARPKPKAFSLEKVRPIIIKKKKKKMVNWVQEKWTGYNWATLNSTHFPVINGPVITEFDPLPGLFKLTE